MGAAVGYPVGPKAALTQQTLKIFYLFVSTVRGIMPPSCFLPANQDIFRSLLSLQGIFRSLLANQCTFRSLLVQQVSYFLHLLKKLLVNHSWAKPCVCPCSHQYNAYPSDK